MSEQSKLPTKQRETKRHQRDEDRAIRAVMEQPLDAKPDAAMQPAAAESPLAAPVEFKQEIKASIDPYYLRGIAQFEKHCIRLSDLTSKPYTDHVLMQIGRGLGAIGITGGNSAQAALAMLGHFIIMTQTAHDELDRINRRCLPELELLDAQQQENYRQAAEQRLKQLHGTIHVLLSSIISSGNKTDLSKLIEQGLILHIPPIPESHEAAYSNLLRQLVFRTFEAYEQRNQPDSCFETLIQLIHQAGRGGWKHRESSLAADSEQSAADAKAQLKPGNLLEAKKPYGGSFFAHKSDITDKVCQQQLFNAFEGGKQLTNETLNAAIRIIDLPKVLLELIQQYVGSTPIKEKKPIEAPEDDSDDDNSNNDAPTPQSGPS